MDLALLLLLLLSRYMRDLHIMIQVRQDQAAVDAEVLVDN